MHDVPSDPHPTHRLKVEQVSPDLVAVLVGSNFPRPLVPLLSAPMLCTLSTGDTRNAWGFS